MQGLLPILFMWAIFAFIGKVSKAAKEQQKKAAAGQKAGQSAAPARAAKPAPKPVPKAPAPAPARATVAPTVESAHHAEPFEAHMHVPTMGEEGSGTEGIDCCHEFMLEQPTAESADFLPLTEQEQDARAKTLLQGVIFSEILGRRPARRYGGKSA